MDCADTAPTRCVAARWRLALAVKRPCIHATNTVTGFHATRLVNQHGHMSIIRALLRTVFLPRTIFEWSSYAVPWYRHRNRGCMLLNHHTKGSECNCQVDPFSCGFVFGSNASSLALSAPEREASSDSLSTPPLRNNSNTDSRFSPPFVFAVRPPTRSLTSVTRTRSVLQSGES